MSGYLLPAHELISHASAVAERAALTWTQIRDISVVARRSSLREGRSIGKSRGTVAGSCDSPRERVDGRRGEINCGGRRSGVKS